MKRYCSLDLLKFIGAIVIMIHHYQASTHSISFINLTNSSMFSGGLFVMMFFIVSGFLSSSRESSILKKDFLSYIKAKIIRFLPMTTLSTLCELLVAFVFVFIFRYWRYDIEPGIWKIINNLTLTYTGGANNFEGNFNGQLWFVSVLIKCYVVFYFINWISDRLNLNKNILYFTFVIIGISCKNYGFNLPFLNDNIADGYIGFFVGVFIYKIYMMFDHKKINIMSIIVLSLLIVLGIVSFDYFYDNTFMIATFLIFPSLIFIFLSLENKLTCRLFKLLGAMSFEIYLWHDVTLGVLACLEGLLPKTFPGHYGFGFEIVFVVLNILLSILIITYIEGPVKNMFGQIIKENNNV